MMRGLYAVTPDCADTEWLAAAVARAVEGGAAAVQYRNKTAPPRLAAEQARRLRRVTADAGIPLIVNDDAALALACGADGVHIGRDDRPDVPAGLLIGVSCYADLARARDVQDTSSYVAFGSFFASPTKPLAQRAPLDLIGQAKSALSIPIVAIGGITLQNAPQLVAAGVDSVAVISDLFGASDIRRQARLFASLFESHV